MKTIKLVDFCKQNSISYITGWRWFNDGQIPGAYQTDSGTILIPDEDAGGNMANTNSNNPSDSMATFLKKTVEFSKNNATVEEFAAYVISNFQLKLNGVVDSPKYSRNKPKSEDVQNHFKQFMPDKEKEEQLKNMKILLEAGKPAGDIIPATDYDPLTVMSDEFNTGTPLIINNLQNTTTGLITRSVDLNTNVQQTNYTGPTDQASSNAVSDCSTVLADNICNAPSIRPSISYSSYLDLFKPTEKEVISTKGIDFLKKVVEGVPKKRGRKPSKKRGLDE